LAPPALKLFPTLEHLDSASAIAERHRGSLGEKWARTAHAFLVPFQSSTRHSLKTKRFRFGTGIAMR
jgi:hypothetical protein